MYDSSTEEFERFKKGASQGDIEAQFLTACANTHIKLGYFSKIFIK